MALYAFDGTWNSAKDDEDKDLTNTNVFRFYQAYKKHSKTDTPAFAARRSAWWGRCRWNGRAICSLP